MWQVLHLIIYTGQYFWQHSFSALAFNIQNSFEVQGFYCVRAKDNNTAPTSCFSELKDWHASNKQLLGRRPGHLNKQEFRKLSIKCQNIIKTALFSCNVAAYIGTILYAPSTITTLLGLF